MWKGKSVPEKKVEILILIPDKEVFRHKEYSIKQTTLHNYKKNKTQ